jgi:hypothetical protein
MPHLEAEIGRRRVRKNTHFPPFVASYYKKRFLEGFAPEISHSGAVLK